mmetsp:Transcript_106832/g.312282  ORF Transcript_106832/g.312282 Transcript_106832/m.312282 type:complete len:326 (+) Transcript_106832:71-1048(+)
MGHHAKAELMYSAPIPASRIVGAINIIIVLVFGGQNLSSYFQSTATICFFLCGCCFLLLPVGCLEMYLYRNVSGRTWQERYGSTPVAWALLGIYYGCFWSFAVHAVRLIANWDCDICAGNPASSKSYFRAAYWLHVFPSFVIAVFSPLQYTESIRKFKSYLIHRWVGRLVLLASVVHQASATVLFASELFFSKADCTLFGDMGQCDGWRYRIYVSGFVPKTVLAWSAIVLGFVRARQGRFAEHGRWMYRLGAMWVITIVVAHIIIYPVGYLVGPQWKYAVGEWTEWLFVIPMEIYIRRSGRFPLGPSRTKEVEVLAEPFVKKEVV